MGYKRPANSCMRSMSHSLRSSDGWKSGSLSTIGNSFQQREHRIKGSAGIVPVLRPILNLAHRETQHCTWLNMKIDNEVKMMTIDHDAEN